MARERKARQEEETNRLRNAVNDSINRTRASTSRLENSLITGNSPVKSTLPNLQPRLNRRSSLLPQKEMVSAEQRQAANAQLHQQTRGLPPVPPEVGRPPSQSTTEYSTSTRHQNVRPIAPARNHKSPYAYDNYKRLQPSTPQTQMERNLDQHYSPVNMNRTSQPQASSRLNFPPQEIQGYLQPNTSSPNFMQQGNHQNNSQNASGVGGNAYQQRAGGQSAFANGQNQRSQQSQYNQNRPSFAQQPPPPNYNQFDQNQSTHNQTYHSHASNPTTQQLFEMITEMKNLLNQKEELNKSGQRIGYHECRGYEEMIQDDSDQSLNRNIQNTDFDFYVWLLRDNEAKAAKNKELSLTKKAQLIRQLHIPEWSTSKNPSAFDYMKNVYCQQVYPLGLTAYEVVYFVETIFHYSKRDHIRAAIRPAMLPYMKVEASLRIKIEMFLNIFP